MADAQPVLVDPFEPRFVEDPYPYYRLLRHEAPLYKPPSFQSLWATRYPDVRMILTDRRFQKQPPFEYEAEKFPPEYSELERIPDSMLFLDPPDHTRLRSLVARAFTPRTVDTMRTKIEEIAKELLDEASRKAEVDLVSEFAFPLPASVIAELLGVPRSDRDRVRRWSYYVAASIDAVLAAREQENILKANLEMLHYFEDLISERRRDRRDDLLSQLISAEEDGDRLTAEEIIAMCSLLLVAGHETTTNLLGTGTYNLLKNPDQFAILREDPDRIPDAIEELLRYDSPVQRMGRFAGEDVEIAGRVVPKGTFVVGVIASANRDETVFEDPDRLDLGRPNVRHLAFGQGIHFCIGAGLARLEAEIGLRALTARLPALALADEPPTWRPHTLLRGLATLPVKV